MLLTFAHLKISYVVLTVKHESFAQLCVYASMSIKMQK